MDRTNEGEPFLAKRWRRLVARIIDGFCIVVLSAIVVAFMYGQDLFTTISHGLGLADDEEALQISDLFFSFSTMFSFSLFVAEVLVYIGLNTYLLGKRGQTIGKWFMNIQIVDFYSGEVPPLRCSLVFREGGLYFIYILGLFGAFTLLIDKLFIFSKTQRCLHDYWAVTKVVDRSLPRLYR